MHLLKRSFSKPTRRLTLECKLVMQEDRLDYLSFNSNAIVPRSTFAGYHFRAHSSSDFSVKLGERDAKCALLTRWYLTVTSDRESCLTIKKCIWPNAPSRWSVMSGEKSVGGCWEKNHVSVRFVIKSSWKWLVFSVRCDDNLTSSFFVFVLERGLSQSCDSHQN